MVAPVVNTGSQVGDVRRPAEQSKNRAKLRGQLIAHGRLHEPAHSAFPNHATTGRSDRAPAVMVAHSGKEARDHGEAPPVHARQRVQQPGERGRESDVLSRRRPPQLGPLATAQVSVPRNDFRPVNLFCHVFTPTVHVPGSVPGGLRYKAPALRAPREEARALPPMAHRPPLPKSPVEPSPRKRLLTGINYRLRCFPNDGNLVGTSSEKPPPSSLDLAGC